MSLLSEKIENGRAIQEGNAKGISEAEEETQGQIIDSVCVSIPGTAGELVQGCLADDIDFLVTNPIDCRSEIRVTISEGRPGVTVFPAYKTKVRRAVIAVLQMFHCTYLNVSIFISSNIPVGKGMASSTADIVGAIEATAQILKHPLTPEQISRIAIAIEPSDGIMYRSIVAYNHRKGYLIESFGPPPLMQQLLVDTGGQVDTVEFNQRVSKEYDAQEIEMFARAFVLVREGIQTADLAKIGHAATISTRINQRLLPKPKLEEMLRIAKQADAYGSACAHSGTIFSLIFEYRDTIGPQRACEAIKDLYNGNVSFLLTRSLSSW